MKILTGRPHGGVCETLAKCLTRTPLNQQGDVAFDRASHPSSSEPLSRGSGRGGTGDASAFTMPRPCRTKWITGLICGLSTTQPVRCSSGSLLTRFIWAPPGSINCTWGCGSARERGIPRPLRGKASFGLGNDRNLKARFFRPKCNCHDGDPIVGYLRVLPVNLS